MSGVYYLETILLVMLLQSFACDAGENKHLDEDRVFWNCKSESGCEIYATTKDNKKIALPPKIRSIPTKI